MLNDKLIGYCRFEDVLPLIECSQKQLLPDKPETVIAMLFPYYAGELPERNVARYAVVNDYHGVAGSILDSTVAQLRAAFPDDSFAAFVDNSPIREVSAAAAAGLGAIGLHGMLIHERFGSRVFIGSIVTSLALKPKPAAPKSCLNCGRCVSACPTGALQTGKPLERKLCRSYISQKKQPLSDWEVSEIKKGGLVWGCDICADACPMNNNLPVTPLKGFRENILPRVTTQNIDEAIAVKPYGWRGKDVILRNLLFLLEKRKSKQKENQSKT